MPWKGRMEADKTCTGDASPLNLGAWTPQATIFGFAEYISGRMTLKSEQLPVLSATMAPVIPSSENQLNGISSPVEQ